MIFAVRLVTWDDSSAIVFVNSAINFLSDCVAIARFASAMVWYCCILVNNAVLDCEDCTLAAYPSFSKFKFNWCGFLVKIKQCGKFKNVISNVVT